MTWRILLLPFSFVYYLVTLLRNKFYDSGLFKSYNTGIPVISVGNISTGGTGKTPFVIFLASQLLNTGKNIAIISRGYKRKSDETLIVFDGENILCKSNDCGDEVWMMASIFRRQNNLIIAVGKDKFKTAEFVSRHHKPELIILDDAFQHRRIKRNIDIVIIDENEFHNNKFISSTLLPAGDLRESISGLKRASIIISNSKFNDTIYPEVFSGFNKDSYEINYENEGLFDINNNIFTGNKPAIAFCGIAKPDSFYDALEKSGFEIKEKISFMDHHEYTSGDINKLINKHIDGTVFITTEKDFVKISKFTEFVTKIPVYYLKIKINFKKDYDKFRDKIFKLIN